MTNGIIDSGQEIVTNGLVLHLDAAQRRSYSGTGTTWTDLSGNGNNGTLTNGPTFNPANGGIIQFDGTNDNVLIPNATSIISTTALTIAMWVKWTTVGTTTSTIQVLFDNNHSANPIKGIVLQDRPDLNKALTFSVNMTNSTQGARSTSIVGDGNWKYVVGTASNNITKIYVNGVLEGQATEGPIAPIQPNITLGIWQGTSFRALNGLIATTSVYNRALSDAEVLQNYNATKARFEVPALLDLYPNAAAAYSLRKLRSGYTGSAIRVRRSSDNTEQDIGFTSTGDLNTTALTTFVGANNGFVTTWYDQSGNNRNATQTTQANQPKIVNSGSIYTDSYGKPWIKGYENNSTSLISSAFTNIPQPFSAHTVLNYTNLTVPSAYPYAVDLDNTNTNLIAAGYYNNHRNYAGANLYNTTQAITQKTYLYSSIFNTTNSLFSVNTNVVTGNVGTFPAQKITLFNAKNLDAALNGYLQEFILYPSNQSANRIGIETNINSYYGIYNSNIDSDAQSFITAAAITDSTQQGAVDALVKDLKNYGLWTKMKAIYPFVGGTANSHKFNLKDPRNVDGAFRLQFFGGWTHSATGAKPDGSTGYADTFLNVSTNFNTTSFNHLSYYSRTPEAATLLDYVIGVGTTTPNISFNGLVIRRSNNSGFFVADYPSNILFRNSGGLNTNGSGYFVGTQQGQNIKLFRNSLLVSSNNQTQIPPGTLLNQTFIFGAARVDNVIQHFTNRECGIATIGDGLTDTEAANLYTAVQKYQTTLGRQV